MSVTTVFFATDIHGSEICWKKFINAAAFYDAQVLILGGDMTGKAIVPLIHQGNATYKVDFLEQEYTLTTQEALLDMEKRIRSRGYYPYRTTRDEIAELNTHPQKVEALFLQQVLQTAQNWLEFAEQKLKGSGVRCFVSPGNDDCFDLDNLLRTSQVVTLAEGLAIPLDEQHTLISSGWSNITPWKTYREESEEALRTRYEAMIRQLPDPRRAIFNFHVPPYASGLDDAPELTADLRPKHAGQSLIPVGSKAGRAVIEQYQPMLGLFGHIHEARATTRIGKTLCINPGSIYEQGRLLGALLKLENGQVKTYQLTIG